MSDFTVLRSLDGYCLVLDKKRIAGGKPDYRGENVLVDWTTEVVYGPVDDLAAENAKLREQGERLFDKTLELGTENAKLVMKLNAEHLARQNVERENAKLRELVRVFYHCTTSGECDECPINGGGPVHLMPDTICDTIHERMRELGVEV